MFGSTTLSAIPARRLLALALATAVVMLPVALPTANAEPDYPPSFYKISADSYMARVGGKIAFKAQTFQSNSPVSYDVSAGGTSVGSGSTQANGDGIARRTITFTVAGVNTVTMSGTSDEGNPLSLSVDVSIRAAGSGNDGDNNGTSGGNDPQADEGGVPFFGGGLPRTGGEIALTALIGLALLGGGAALVVATRRRKTS